MNRPSTPTRIAAIQLARSAISCASCFESSQLTRAEISLPQPFAVSKYYRRGGTAVVGINPGASMDGQYKEERKRALDRFFAGDDAAMLSYWNALATDADNSWNPKYLACIHSLGLALDELLVGNIALCATAGNKYPSDMLENCWKLHSSSFLKHFSPGVLILMGSSSVMGRFERYAQQTLPESRVVRIAHYAHREGHAHEVAECERVLAVLKES